MQRIRTKLNEKDEVSVVFDRKNEIGPKRTRETIELKENAFWCYLHVTKMNTTKRYYTNKSAFFHMKNAFFIKQTFCYIHFCNNDKYTKMHFPSTPII